MSHTSETAHSHDHGHTHGCAHNNRTRLGWAALLTGGFMVVEVAGGMISGSLALLADAGHMFIDFASLALAWFAARLSQRPADARRTYGFERFAVLIAFVNGLSLFAIAGFIVVEAARRLMEPYTIEGPLMMSVAIAGLLVNIVAFAILHGGDRNNLNMRGAVLHVLGDMLGSVAAIAAAILIMLTDLSFFDPLLSVLVALVILKGGWGLVRQSGHILLEGAPADLDTKAVSHDLLANVEGLKDVHHVHAWSISQERKMMTLHACMGEQAPMSAPEMVAAIKARVAQKFGAAHVTVEIEQGRCADMAENRALSDCKLS